MTKKDLHDRRFYKARQEASFVKEQALQTEQTQSPSYKLAFQDTDFLLREELRPVRFQLELLKPEHVLREQGIASTVVVFGSARVVSEAQARAALDEATAQTPDGTADADAHAARLAAA